MFKRNRLIIFAVSAAVVIAAALFIQSRYVLPVIMYHSISPAPVKGDLLAVSAGTFERQMRFLKEHRYNVIRVEDLNDYAGGRKKIPPRAVAVTFDDGFKDNYTNAFPVLRKYNIPATVFIIVSKVGEPDRLSWDQIREMQASGLITFGSHTLTHQLLCGIKSDADLEREIAGSKADMEEKLGRKVSLFCYPCGNFDDRVKEIVRESGYESAVAVNPGAWARDNDIWAFKRLRISENARNMFVFRVEISGYYNFLRELRQGKHKS